MRDLGGLVSAHRVDNRPRWILAALCCAVGMFGIGLLAVVVLYTNSTAAGRLAGAGLFLAVGGFGMALSQGVRAHGGGPAEVIEVHALGVVHKTRAGRAQWPWRQLHRAAVHQRPRPTWRARFGWDFHVTFVFAFGPALTITGLTEDPQRILAAARRGRPDLAEVADAGLPLSLTARILLWLGVVAGASGAVSSFVELNTEQSVQDTVTDNLFAVILLGSAVTAVLCLTFLFFKGFFRNR